jgi:hypothetical protein
VIDSIEINDIVYARESIVTFKSLLNISASDLAKTPGIDARIANSTIKETIATKATAKEISDTAKESIFDPVIMSVAGAG